MCIALESEKRTFSAFEWGLLLFFWVTHDTHMRAVVKDRTAIPTKIIYEIPIETFLY